MEYGGNVQYSFANEASRKLFGSPWKFQKHGQCGMDFSELLPNTAKIADDLCLIRSMHTGHNGHEVSIRYINAGITTVIGRPSLGAWLTYGLGSENDELPAYMVLKDPDGKPVDGNHNWSNGWLPSLYQGTVLRAKEPRIFNLQRARASTRCAARKFPKLPQRPQCRPIRRVAQRGRPRVAHRQL